MVATRPIGRGEGTVAALMSFGVVAAFVVVAGVDGALGVSRNDDWAYYRVAFRLATDGVFALDGWTQMFLGAQAALAWPIVRLFGPAIAPLQIGVAVMAAVGIWGTYLLVRGFLSSSASYLAVGCLALGPVFGSLSVSFMTDVPSYSIQVWTLLAIGRALRPSRVSLSWFGLALALATVAFGVREYALVAGITACISMLVRTARDDRPLLSRVIVMVVCWLAIVVGLSLLRGHVPGSIPTRVHVDLARTASLLATLGAAALTLALFVTPAVASLAPIRLVKSCWARTPVVTSVALGAVLAVALSWNGHFLGNYLTVTGSYPETLLGGSPLLLPPWAWVGLGLASLVSFVGLTLLLVAWPRNVILRTGSVPNAFGQWDASPAGIVGLFTVLASGAIVSGMLLTGGPGLDRYLIVLVPFVAALVLHTGAGLGVVASNAGVKAVLALAILAVVGVRYIDAAATFDGAKWRMAEMVERTGVPANLILGGFEWWGYHQSDVINLNLPLEDRKICAIGLHDSGVGVDGSPLPDADMGRLVARGLTGIDYPLVALPVPDCRLTLPKR